ncbi:hypothetical protein FB45DRAFT_1125637 [Roridomyces roridus]|uniref:Uncharacterized protein n=1 Tax=Roridomyces roridus TaxID=1738132 RepID=A0AAD7C843_9AGAR|nr:hypothetical protein FB45DRAFT_1125637 [Roridomyces roridus]
MPEMFGVSAVEIPELDQRFLDDPGTIHLLPTKVPFNRDTKWVPALFVDFDPDRSGAEYAFQCAPGTILDEIGFPDTFNISSHDWDHTIRGAYPPVTDQSVPDAEEFPPFDPQLLQLFRVAIPSISALIVQDDRSHLIIHNFYKNGQVDGWKASDWVFWASGFSPCPALAAIIDRAILELARFTLGEPFALNGDTFDKIHTGSLLLTTPPGVHVLQSMLAQHRGVGSVIGGSSRVFEPHTRYDASPRLTFFNRLRQNPAVKPEIPVILEGRQISSVADIPPPPPPLPRPTPKPLYGQFRTRKTGDVDDSADEVDSGVGEEEPKPKRTKWAPAATPPGVRRT